MSLSSTSNLLHFPGISSDIHRGRRVSVDTYSLTHIMSRTPMYKKQERGYSHATSSHTQPPRGKEESHNPTGLLLSISSHLEQKVCISMPDPTATTAGACRPDTHPSIFLFPNEKLKRLSTESRDRYTCPRTYRKKPSR